MEGGPKKHGRLAENRCYHYDKRALSPQTMPSLEDDKWYVSDAAISAMPALISSLDPLGDSEAELKKYAHTIAMLAHLIGMEMLLSRENTFAAIEQTIEEQKNAEA